MPLYEYQCGQCGRFEVIRKFADTALEACPTCGGEIIKLPSAPAIQFKGTGWYVTDYARKSGGGDGAGTSSSTSGKDGKDGRESKDSKESRDSKDSKDSKDTKGGSSTPTTTTSKDSSANGSSPTK